MLIQNFKIAIAEQFPQSVTERASNEGKYAFDNDKRPDYFFAKPDETKKK
jgi:hypothetical protein